MSPCEKWMCILCVSCTRASGVRYPLTLPCETTTQVILSRRGRHPLGQLATRCIISPIFINTETRGEAVRAIQNLKFWPFNYSVPIGPISVSLSNATTQMQTASSCKIGQTVWNGTWAVKNKQYGGSLVLFILAWSSWFKNIWFPFLRKKDNIANVRD